MKINIAYLLSCRPKYMQFQYTSTMYILSSSWLKVKERPKFFFLEKSISVHTMSYQVHKWPSIKDMYPIFWSFLDLSTHTWFSFNYGIAIFDFWKPINITQNQMYFIDDLNPKKLPNWIMLLKKVVNVDKKPFRINFY